MYVVAFKKTSKGKMMHHEILAKSQKEAFEYIQSKYGTKTYFFVCREATPEELIKIEHGDKWY